MSKILLIEDMAGVRETLAATLERSGHSLVTAVDGEEGLASLEEGDFDLVITDIIMPKVDGTEVAVRAKEKGIRVIAVSGGGATVSSDQALMVAAQMADIVLKKPFSVKELTDAVDTLTLSVGA